MLKRNITVALTGVMLAITTISADAGLKLSDEKSGIGLEIGGRLQVMALFNDKDFKPNDDIDFRVRRGRLRLGITPHPKLSMFLQTEFADDVGGSGGDVRLIDAYINFKQSPWLQFISGLNMAPAQRQTLTSSGGLMAMDRPGITNYNLTWGMKGNTALQTGTVNGTQVGTFGDNQVRDMGVTLFGSGKVKEKTYFKYYLGMAEGSKYSDDTQRISARAQINFGDAEAGYYNLSTYLGKKETIGLGVAIDTQNSFATDIVTGEQVDYSLFTVDGFLEKPMGGGSLTLEAAYTKLDLGDTVNGLASQTGVALKSGTTANQAQGDGFYIQGGYLMGDWQPFLLAEQWSADAAGGVGSWDSVRAGINYYLKGHNANIKLSVENTSFDAAGVEDITTAAIGLYITY